MNGLMLAPWRFYALFNAKISSGHMQHAIGVDSDQPSPPRSLIRVYAVCLYFALVTSVDSGQTVYAHADLTPRCAHVIRSFSFWRSTISCKIL